MILLTDIALLIRDIRGNDNFHIIILILIEKHSNDYGVIFAVI